MFATVTVVGQIGRSALLVACAAGRIDVARWLLASAGCDAKLDRDEVCGHVAHSSVAACIREASYGAVLPPAQCECTALLSACRRGHLDLARWLVTEGGSDARSERDKVRRSWCYCVLTGCCENRDVRDRRCCWSDRALSAAGGVRGRSRRCGAMAVGVGGLRCEARP
jgi:hypothetical protein